MNYGNAKVELRIPICVMHLVLAVVDVALRNGSAVVMVLASLSNNSFSSMSKKYDNSSDQDWLK
jgi:hypothetical protein